MLRILKPLLGMLLFTSASCLSDNPGIAATFSEIPLDAVTIQTDELLTSKDSLNFRVGVVDLPQLDPNWRLTSFTAVLTDRDGNAFPSNFRAWSGIPVPGWRAIAIAQTPSNLGGYRFEAIDPNRGIAPGDSLGGFTARSSAVSTNNNQLQISSVSTAHSTAVPETKPPLGILAMALGLLWLVTKQKAFCPILPAVEPSIRTR